MKKQKINLAFGRESSKEEVEFVEETFKYFDITSGLNYVRCSAGDLPFIVFITIATGVLTSATYDMIKLSVKKILARINRNPQIVIRTENEEWILTTNYIAIRKMAEDIGFNSVDELFDYLKKRDQDK